MWNQIWTTTAALSIVGGLTGGLNERLLGQEKAATQALSQPPGKTRHFEFNYAASVNGLAAGDKIRVWIPIPQSNPNQLVEQFSQHLPAGATIATEPTYGNRILYFETKAPATGQINFDVDYRVKRSEVLGLKLNNDSRLTDLDRKLFLAANSKVPIDGKPLQLLMSFSLPEDDMLELAEMLYNRVDDHMRYDKSMPGYGTGDANWACDSRFGNCTDFHSLFISLMRSQGVPARFEIGFPLPDERGEGEIGGYHCWAFFFVESRGWIPVDISEADKHPDMKDYYFGNLTENRVTFTVGRDMTLVPKQQGEPLNFFIYPHVEVNGGVWPQEKVETSFRFKDIDQR